MDADTTDLQFKIPFRGQFTSATVVMQEVNAFLGTMGFLSSMEALFWSVIASFRGLTARQDTGDPNMACEQSIYMIRSSFSFKMALQAYTGVRKECLQEVIITYLSEHMPHE